MLAPGVALATAMTSHVAPHVFDDILDPSQ